MKKSISIIIALMVVVVMSAMLLTACAPNSDPAKAESALKSNGYDAVRTTGYVSGIVSAIAGVENNIEGTVTGTKTVEDKDGNSKSEYVFIIYYKTADAAKAAWEDMKDDSEKEKKENKADDSDWESGRSGKLIYWGTKAAVKAAR